MLATILMVLGVVSVVSVMSKGMSADQTVDQSAVALRLAQEAIEAVKNSPDTSFAYLCANYGTNTQVGTNTTPYCSDTACPDGGCSCPGVNVEAPFAAYQRSVCVSEPQTGLAQVVVNVTWQYKSSPMQVGLTTYIGDGSRPTTTTAP